MKKIQGLSVLTLIGRKASGPEEKKKKKKRWKICSGSVFGRETKLSHTNAHRDSLEGGGLFFFSNFVPVFMRTRPSLAALLSFGLSLEIFVLYRCVPCHISTPYNERYLSIYRARHPL